MKKIGILTGGGDCPGLNGAIKWLVKTCEDPGTSAVPYEVIGIRDGWKGLVKGDPDRIMPPFSEFGEEGYFKHLTSAEVRPWDRQGGTRLGTSRTNPFNPKNDRSDVVIKNIERLGLHAIVAIGGEDTLSVAAKLSERGIPTVGIPKTIDRDLAGTEYSIGFETAVNVITEEVDRLRTTAGSHSRTFVVETMGRHAGHLALQGGMSAGAYVILIPEHDYDLGQVCSLVARRRQAGIRYSIVIIAEGAKPKGGSVIQRTSGLDDFGHVNLGGVGEVLAQEIAKATGLETRAVVLSHLQRGGTPCAYDRRMARNFGICAVNLIQNGRTGRMVSFLDGKYTSVPLSEIIGKLALVDVEREYDTRLYNGKRTILPL
ncbi:MAG: ATP-dependent 6-phosphofructokinase [Deltaproteobacteria bacterium]|nr:ATP-dependent 6-phosphofructokinase [Deltaproteobacteria bacterium]